MTEPKIEPKICRHCKDARLETNNILGPYHQLECPACGHVHLLRDEGTKDEEFILCHDNKCGCTHLGREKGSDHEKSDPDPSDSVDV